MKLLDEEGLKSKGIIASKPSLRRWEKAGQFPKRIQVSAGRHAWLESEIDEWIRERAAAREAAVA